VFGVWDEEKLLRNISESGMSALCTSLSTWWSLRVRWVREKEQLPSNRDSSMGSFTMPRFGQTFLPLQSEEEEKNKRTPFMCCILCFVTLAVLT